MIAFLKFLSPLFYLVFDFIPDFEMDVGEFSVGDDVLNIFAWASYILPVDLILRLIALTSAFYALKFAFRLFRFILSFFGVGG